VTPPTKDMTTTTKRINPRADAAAQGGSATDLKALATLSTKLLKLQAEADQMEDELKAKRQDIKLLAETTIPDAMAACGMKEFTLANGYKLKIQDITAGSIPEKNRTEAFAWLRTHGFGWLIKTDIKVTLGKDSESLAARAIAALEKLKIPAEVKEAVHPQTLAAWVREEREGGNQKLPLDLLGIFIGKRVKVDPPTK